MPHFHFPNHKEPPVVKTGEVSDAEIIPVAHEPRLFGFLPEESIPPERRSFFGSPGFDPVSGELPDTCVEKSRKSASNSGHRSPAAVLTARKSSSEVMPQRGLCSR